MNQLPLRLLSDRELEASLDRHRRVLADAQSAVFRAEDARDSAQEAVMNVLNELAIRWPAG